MHAYVCNGVALPGTYVYYVLRPVLAVLARVRQRGPRGVIAALGLNLLAGCSPQLRPERPASISRLLKSPLCISVSCVASRPAKMRPHLLTGRKLEAVSAAVLLSCVASGSASSHLARSRR